MCRPSKRRSRPAGDDSVDKDRTKEAKKARAAEERERKKLEAVQEKERKKIQRYAAHSEGTLVAS